MHVCWVECVCVDFGIVCVCVCVTLLPPAGHPSLNSPGSLRSDSSISDQSSDEEYMCPLTKKKPKPKKPGQKPREEKKVEPQYLPSEEEEEEEVFGEPRLKPVVLVPPPKLIQSNQSVLREGSTDIARKPVSKPVKLEAPPLIRTPDRYLATSHRQSLSSEIRVVPGKSMGGAVGGAVGGALRKQQQPQVPKLKPKLESSSPVISLPRVQPQVILSPGVQRPPPPLVSSKSRDQSRGHAHSSMVISSSSPHKSHKSSKKVAIDPSLLGPSPRSQKPLKSVAPLSFSSHSKKPKPHPHQYGVITASPAHSHKPHPSPVSQAMPISYPTVQLPTSVSRVMTPFQLMSPTQTQDSHSMAISSQGMTAYQQAMGSGGIIFLQGGAPQTAYFSQGGQTYQIINHPGAGGETAQKVSVIMQPPAGATFLTPTDLQGGIQYISQLDGPPDQEKSPPRGGQGDKSRENFEKMRRKEQEKLGLAPSGEPQEKLVLTSGEPHTFQTPQEDVEPPRGQGSIARSHSPEDRMSEKLKFYLAREKERAASKSSSSTTATQQTGEAISGGNYRGSLQTTPSATVPGDSPLTSPRQQQRRRHSSSSSSKSPSAGRGGKPTRLVVSPTIFHVSTSQEPTIDISPGTPTPQQTTTMSTTTTTNSGARVKRSAAEVARLRVTLHPKPLFAPDNLIPSLDLSPHTSLGRSGGVANSQTTPTSIIETETVSQGQQRQTQVECLNSNGNNNGKSDSGDLEPDKTKETHSHTGNSSGMESGPSHSRNGTEPDSLPGEPNSAEETVFKTPRKRGRPPRRGRGRGRGQSRGGGATTAGSSGVDNQPIGLCPTGQQPDEREGESEVQDRDTSGQPSTETESKTPLPKKKRGRPKKSATQETTSSGQRTGENVETESGSQDTPQIRTRRKRGRDEALQDTPTGGRSGSESEVRTPKRQRGRPRSTGGNSGRTKSFTCKNCDKTFPSNYYLQVHTDNEHPPDLGVRHCQLRNITSLLIT